jgi:hypothetical protein
MFLSNEEICKIFCYIKNDLETSYTVSGIAASNIEIKKRRNRKNYQCQTCGAVLHKGGERVVISAKTSLASKDPDNPRSIFRKPGWYSLHFCNEEHCKNFILTL